MNRKLAGSLQSAVEIVVLLLLLAAISIAARGQARAPISDEQYVNTVVYPATALLYSQNEEGGMAMRCTATAISKTDKGYEFVTASHCACQDEHEGDHEWAKFEETFFFITPDNPGHKEFLKAKPLACGYQHRGDDFALFTVETTDAFPLVLIGKDVTDHSGQPIVNIASPGGLGRQTFKGVVSAPVLDRSVTQDEINWTNAMMVQITGVNGGSSGSAIVCLSQRAICGFLVGTVEETNTIAIPVSRYTKFRNEWQHKTYKYFKPKDE